MTEEQIEREHERLDREIEWLLAEMADRGITDEAARIFAELETDERNWGLGASRRSTGAASPLRRRETPPGP